jgi:hypothetical protein
MLLLHNCLFGLNVFTELGTKLLFLLIKKNPCKNKHQKVASQASVKSSFLTLYVQFLCKSFVSVQSIKNYISGVKNLHSYTENKFPQKDTFQLNLILKVLSRLNPHCPKQASPITPDILL